MSGPLREFKWKERRPKTRETMKMIQTNISVYEIHLNISGRD